MIGAFLKFLAAVVVHLRLWYWSKWRLTSAPVLLKVLKEYKFTFIPKGDIVRILYGDQPLVQHRKSFEYDTLELFVKHIQPGHVILDIGANVGLYSLLASIKSGKQGKVIAFEPTAPTYELLQKNIQLNQCDNIITVKQALADKSKPVVMRKPISADAKYQDAFHQIKEVDQGDEEAIFTITLDQYVEDFHLSRIDLMKIDIEGAEFLFFKGAEQTLRRWKPTLLFECNEHHCKAFGNNVIDVLCFVKDIGYSVTQTSTDQWLAVEGANKIAAY